MDSRALLGAAKALLQNGSSWTKRANAIDAQGKAVPVMHPNAVRWDVYGALLRAHIQSGIKSFEAFHEAYRTLQSRIPIEYRNRDIESYNDVGAFALVIALFDDSGGSNVGPAISILADNTGRVILFNDLAIEVEQ